MSTSQDSWSGSGSGGGFYRAYQTFTTSSSYTLSRVDLRCSSVAGVATGIGTVKLYTYAGGGSLGFLQGTLGTIDSSALGTSPEWVTLDSFTPIELSSPTTYAIVITMSGGISYVNQADIPTLYWYGAGGYDNGTGYHDFWTFNGDVSRWVPNGSYQNAGIDFNFITYSEGHSKATNPTPANAATEVDWSTPTLSWSGTGDSYTVYVATSGGGFIASDIVYEGANTTTTLDSSEISTLIPTNGLVDVLYWRVDSTKDGSTLTGDTWTFDPRPGKASNPSPADSASDVSISTGFSWDIGTNGTTMDVVLGGSSVLSGTADTTYSLTEDIFSWGDTTTWRVDTINEYGTTTGDSWTFDAVDLDHLKVTYTPIGGGSGPYDGGVEGVDFYYTGLNNVITVKRLIAAAKDRLYYEQMGDE